MKLALVDADGGKGREIEVSDSLFNRDFNESLVHQVVTAYQAAGRAGTVAQKNRAAVRGGGRKPWRQKGTGRARAGTIRSPLWRGGGKIFPAQPQDHSQKVNRKMYRGAMRSILSELIRQDRLVVVDSFTLEVPKTKALVAKLKSFGMKEVLIVSECIEENLYLAARNLPTVWVAEPSWVDPVSLVRFEHIVMTESAVRKFEEALSHVE